MKHFPTEYLYLLVYVFLNPVCVCVLADLEQKANNETKEEKNPRRPVDRINTRQEEMKTDEVGQKEVENSRQQAEQQLKAEEGDNQTGAAGSLQGSGQHYTGKKEPDSHTEKLQRQRQNGTVGTII